MGESIFEGTITKWLKKPGDKVNRDEPLFEISTDKVDSEIPSPAAGTLQEILVNEGQTVQINTVVAVIGDGAAKTAAAPPKAEARKGTPQETNPSIKAGPTPDAGPAPDAEEVADEGAEEISASSASESGVVPRRSSAVLRKNTASISMPCRARARGLAGESRRATF
jgi:2-oxoglutarate dehydrogenase E2 component (dihydrolipoamide succinyltransferase)